MECLQSISTSHGIPHIALYSNARRIQKLSNPNNPSRKTTSIHSPLFSNFISPLLPLTPSRFSSSSTTVKSAVPENQASVETDEWAMQDFYTFRKDVEVTMERVTEIRRSSGLEKLQEDLAALENKATDSTLWDDQAKAQETLSALTEVKDKIKMLTDFKSQVEDADMIVKLTEEMDSVDAKLVEEAKNTIRDLNKALDSFELTQLLSGPYDKKGAVISITAGAGGTDAQDWADMILRMYIRWGEKQRYKTRVTEKSMGEEAGIKSATLELEGSYAYGYLSGEKGAHRIVRQSPFNSKGLCQDVSSWSTRSHIYFTRRSASFSIHYRKQNQFRVNERSSLCVFALSSESEKAGVSTTSLDGISVAATTTSEPLELKIRIDVTGAKTQAIFDNVFSKMVADAQPIPGFRRVKGGKTPNIPKDILLQVLGPEKVYKNVIKRIINSSIVDYVEKEGLKITKDLSVEQNYDELEAKFEPGTEFSFDAFIHLQEASKEN